MTLLHQACAAGDVDLVELLTQSLDTLEHLGQHGIESRMLGRFVHDVIPPSIEELHELSTPCNRKIGQTPLEIALISCRSDDASIQIVKALIRAGAQVVFREDGPSS